MDSFAHSLLEITHGMGYFGIFIMMAIESSFLPIPAELIIPPAAYLAFLGRMNLILIFVFAISGSVFGALFNYYLARFLGRPLVYILANKRWAKYLGITEKRLAKAEVFFTDYEEISTFLGRLVIGVRHLISLPAGFVKMNVWYFMLFTALGSGLWISVLVSLGYFFGKNHVLIVKFVSFIGIFFSILGVIVGIIIYIRIKNRPLWVRGKDYFRVLARMIYKKN